MEEGRQGLLLGQGVVGLVLEQAAALQQTQDALGGALRYAQACRSPQAPGHRCAPLQLTGDTLVVGWDGITAPLREAAPHRSRRRSDPESGKR